MVKSASIVSLLVALALGALVARGGAQLRAEEVIAQTMQTYAASWNARDARALNDLYTQDADYTGFGSVMARGRDEIEARYSALFAPPNDPGHMVLEVSSLRFLKPDVALVDGTFQLTPTTSGSGDSSTRAQFVTVLTSDQDTWRITAFWSKRVEAAK